MLKLSCVKLKLQGKNFLLGLTLEIFMLRTEVPLKKGGVLHGVENKWFFIEPDRQAYDWDDESRTYKKVQLDDMNELERYLYSDAFPPVKRTFSKDYYMGKYEVTNIQFKAVFGFYPWEEKKNLGSEATFYDEGGQYSQEYDLEPISDCYKKIRYLNMMIICPSFVFLLMQLKYFLKS